MNNPTYPDVSELAYALGTPTAQARIRQSPEDFQVDEELGFQPDGEGDHIWLQLRKRNTNTDWLAQQLVKFAGVKPVDVSYAGLKDRHAVTSQWFSIKPDHKQPEPDWQALNNEEIEVLAVVAHPRKLRRGTLQGNRFKLILRDVQGDKDELEQRLQKIAQQGVPNYFGEQRFGRNGNNLSKSIALFAGALKRVKRQERGLYISAARSFLFNQVLSERVTANTWQSILPGEVLQLDGSHSVFCADADDKDLAARLQAGDIHPTACLWGTGDSLAKDTVFALEQSIAQRYPELSQGLESVDLKPERRTLCLPAREWHWQWLDEQNLELHFYLDSGSYATVILRELILEAVGA